MLTNIRLYTRIDGKLAKFVLDQAESIDEAINVVREASGKKTVFAVIDGITKV